MITVMKALVLINTFATLSALNPMKMSFLVLFFSFLTFMILNKLSGESWFSMIFFLLFMGGILIMFMILSSLAPNEKSLKSKINTMTLLTLMLVSSTFILAKSSLGSESMVKWAMSSDYNMEFMVILILSYFFSFILVLSSKKMSMRSL